MSENNPKISIILPIYNVLEYLPKCMDSLLNQTYSNTEIIMIDDGSTDGCAEYCDQINKSDERIIVFHKTNGGLSDARNYGIERATGEYITCVDSDDYIDEDYIEYLLSLIIKYKTKLSICQHRVLFDSGKVIDYGNQGDELLSSRIALERMLYHDVIDTSAWAKLYHVSLFDSIRYPKGHVFEDIGTTYKFFIQSEDIAVGYESKYNYIKRDNSIVTGSFNPSKFDLILMTDRMALDVVSKYSDLKKAALRRQVYSRISTLNAMIGVKGYYESRAEIVDYIRKNSTTVLLDSRTPKRDRIAIRLIKINYILYAMSWKLYQFFNG